MRHSCGHKAPSDMSKDVVRRMPRCTLCADKSMLKKQLDDKVTVLARMWPYTGFDRLWAAVWYNARNLRQAVERADMFIANGLDSDLIDWVSERELREIEHHALTGD